LITAFDGVDVEGVPQQVHRGVPDASCGQVLADDVLDFIMATAQTLGIPLVTADSAITASGLVEVIW
jgi:hypothetical protein